MSLATRLQERLRSTLGGGAPGVALPVPPVGFTDGTVALRPWRPSDGLDLSALCDDPEIHRFTAVPRDYPAREAAGNAAFAEEQRLEGRGVHLAITDAHDAVLLGAIDLAVSGPDRDVGRVSFLLGAAARGEGHATRAVRLLEGWAFRTVGVGGLELRPQRENAAAIAVADRCGFVRGTDGGDGRVTFTRPA
ncbi:GNAT family N-acetyltransferase [Patulibacter minatonensis]|uniref:GNAT family N-acetyltransferase n=1 Tax=Patulibacter minatonensis TaxID=298163 RepID=UPI0004B884FD|nr:GNAT family N-acetyltransferase [Patulibacter minatonensis]